MTVVQKREGEVHRFLRQTFTLEGRAEKRLELELKTYQTALIRFNEALAPFEDKMRSLGDDRSMMILPIRREAHTKAHPTFPSGQISYLDLKVVRKESTFVFTATTDVDDWIRMLANKKNPDDGPTYRQRHARRIRRDVLVMDGNGTITAAQSGHGYTSVSHELERNMRIKFPRRFRNVKHIVDCVEMKPIPTIPEQTVALGRVTQLLQKASGLDKKKSKV